MIEILMKKMHKEGYRFNKKEQNSSDVEQFAKRWYQIVEKEINPLKKIKGCFL